LSTSPTVHRLLFATLAIFAFIAGRTASAQAPQVLPLTQISTDTFTNNTSQHATEVEADTHSVGSTIVSVFQVGRFTDGGASDVGFSTSTDGGTTWTHGNLPGITKIEGSGTWDRATDPAIVYDAKHKVWLAEVLGMSGTTGAAVLVSSSVDGITWKNPSTVSTVEPGGFYDKPWIGCDTSPTSSFYGNCYVTWDDFAQGDVLNMSTSKDGGKTWGVKKTVGGGATGTGGIPLVQPNGTVIVPADDPFFSTVMAFKSTNGGSSWSAPVAVAPINEHGVGGGMRAFNLIGAQIDGGGRVYVSWFDCSFRPGCSSNDIVFSTSDDGTTWSAPSRVPIDAVSSTVDHFTAGWAIDPATSGSTAHVSITYYFFPIASCTSNCKLGVGYIASTNGGSTWTRAKKLSKGANPNWLATTSSGQMVGDYTSGAFASGKVHSAFSVAKVPVGSTFNEEMFTNAAGLADAGEEESQYSSRNDKPVPNAHSDHPRRTTPYHEDGR
jgi:hypothetical protein